jgi:hypothetical protein
MNGNYSTWRLDGIVFALQADVNTSGVATLQTTRGRERCRRERVAHTSAEIE